MKNLNKKIIEDDIKKQLSNDKYELPIQLFRNLKSDIFECFSNYTNIEKDNLSMSIKVLKNNNYYVEISCLIDDYLFLNVLNKN